MLKFLASLAIVQLSLIVVLTPAVAQDSHSRLTAAPDLASAAAAPASPASAQPQAPGSTSEHTEILRQVSDVAKTAIESAQADVNIVKWVFIVVSAAGGLLTFYGFKSIREIREHYKTEAERDAAELTEMRKSLGRILIAQEMVESNYAQLSRLAGEKQRLQQGNSTPDRVAMVAEELEAIGGLVLKDLKEIRDRLDKVDSLRWTVWTKGWQGLALHSLGRYDEAQAYLEAACSLAHKLDGADKLSLGTHAYNLACCYAKLGKEEEAIEKLEVSLSVTPWLRGSAVSDTENGGDFEKIKDHPLFNALITRFSK